MKTMAPTLQGEWIKVEERGGQGLGKRSSHDIAVVRDKLYSFGGENPANASLDKDLYVFDFNTHTWSIAPPNGDAPNVKALGTHMVAVGTKLYLFGRREKKTGENPRLVLSTRWLQMRTKCMYDVFGAVNTCEMMETRHWFKTVVTFLMGNGLSYPGEKFQIRAGAGFAVVQGKIWVVYGFASSPYDLSGRNDYESDAKWTEVETRGDKPSARSVFVHVVVGIYILIFGGEVKPDPNGHNSPGTLTNQGFALDTETLVWKNFGGGDGQEKRGWTAYTTATVYGKKIILMRKTELAEGVDENRAELD
ncbi:unnamed protein product [Thlaspi arvense]|uniref:Uncharacterized protein n=1 Tax=Thlaspi arvense TaxID=13288 RepID=A0AAU9RMC5_THLAR|nr:unnamed protein product [Thlaspi arvense]